MHGDPYSILGVERGTNMNDIKRQYKALVKKYHPDVNPQYKQKFEQIQWAYDQIKSGNVSTYQPEVNIDDIFKVFRKPTFQMKNVKVNVKVSLDDIVNKREVTFSFVDGQQKFVKFIPNGLEPSILRLTIENITYTIHIHPEISDSGFRYDNGKLIKEVRLSAQEFIDLNTIDVVTVTSTIRLHLKAGTTTGQMMKINGAGINGDPLYVNIIVYK